MAPSYIVISPGPCDPNTAGISLAVVDNFAGKIPLLGVCLGHQCIAQYFGGTVKKAKKVMHGKTSKIQHNEKGLFHNVTNPQLVTRYHSLIVEPSNLPEELLITAWSTDESGELDEIMALQHQSLPICSVQFHPESVLTEQGKLILENFIKEFKNFPIT